MIIAPGKAAEAAARGKRPHHPVSFFSSGLPRKHSGQTGRKKRGDYFLFVTPGGASLARGYCHIIPAGFQLEQVIIFRGKGPSRTLDETENHK
jgi:hypothetical protein